jgi:hypothetical protein
MQIEPSLRASDADRDRVAERLRQATAEGRLDGDELEGRLQILFAARTYGELGALLADLPAARCVRRQPRRITRPAAAIAAFALALAALGAVMIARLHSAAGVAVAGSGGGRQFRFRLPLADPNHALILAGSMFAAIAVLLVCVVALWVMTQSRGGIGRLRGPMSRFHSSHPSSRDASLGGSGCSSRD